jgi:hypothetical protein
MVSALRNQRSSRTRVRADPAQQFAIEKSLFERRRGFTVKYFLLLCLLCAMLLKIFYRLNRNLAEEARLTR